MTFHYKNDKLILDFYVKGDSVLNGYIFNIQRFSVHDGPGIRTNVFLKGCPLRCIWCHNPEGLRPVPQIRYSSDKFSSCGDCASVCPSGAHTFDSNMHYYNFDKCLSCMRCSLLCPSDALQADGEEKSVEDIINAVISDRDYYNKSGGGMTLSGGEPFYQPDFAVAVLRAAKELGIHTAVETCGIASSSVFESAAPYVDLFLFDYKVTGEERHKELTGASQVQILKNLDLLEKLGSQVILRCPVIPGINDNDEHYRGIAHIADSHININEINIMPYHSLGIAKGIKVGIKPAFSAESMSYDTAEKIKAEIKKYTFKSIKVI